MSSKNKLTKSAKADLRAAEKLRKQAKKEAQLLAKKQIKQMRPYLKSLKNIDLRKEISAAQRGYITKAFNEFTALNVRPTKVYRTKDKKKLRAVQAASQHIGTVKFDVAFVPTADPKAKIKVQKDRIIISSKYVDEVKVLFDMRALADDPDSEVKRVMDANPDFEYFRLLAGEYYFNGEYSKSLVSEKVREMMLKYSPGGKGYEKRGPNSYYQNWLIGLQGLRAKNQAGIGRYMKEYKEAQLAAKKRRVSAKRKAQYEAMKKANKE